MKDVINKNAIESFVNSELRGQLSINVTQKTESTNTLVKTGALAEDEGFFVIAGEQTAGRGRLGRSFFSPEDTGIYMSLLLKPEMTGEEGVQITTAAAVALCRVFDRVGVENAGIKWVNDIFVSGKKVCGILTEGALNKDGTFSYAVLGVGINVYSPKDGFPQDISNIAGALFTEEKENLRNRIAGEFLNEFFKLYKGIPLKKHIKEYSERCIVTGKSITVFRGTEQFAAFCESVDENCALNIVLPDGTKEKLLSGEVSVRI